MTWSDPPWVELERGRETLDCLFAEAVPAPRHRAVRAVCANMWQPFVQSVREHVPHARIIGDKFHVLRHANDAPDEPRRAESFCQGGHARGLFRGNGGYCCAGGPTCTMRRLSVTAHLPRPPREHATL